MYANQYIYMYIVYTCIVCGCILDVFRILETNINVDARFSIVDEISTEYSYALFHIYSNF